MIDPNFCPAGHPKTPDNRGSYTTAGKKATYCKPCNRARWHAKPAADKKAWTRRYKERRAAYDLLRLYGLTTKDFEELWAAQAGLCGLCGEPMERTKTGCHVDHDHTTGRVRGLVHGRCNVLLGFVEKNGLSPQSIADYLERHRS